MQALEKNIERWQLVPLIIVILMSVALPSLADSKRLVLSLDLGPSLSGNLGDKTLSDKVIDYFQLGLEVGYMPSENDQLSALIQCSVNGVSSIKNGESFGVINPVLSFFWHHYFMTNLDWLEFESLLAIGIGAVLAPAFEDAVLIGPLFIHAGGGVLFLPYKWLGIGLDARVRVGIPSHIAWVSGVISTNVQFRFDL